MIQGSKPGSLDGFFTTQGGSYYRAIARDQVYGLSARGLAINTAIPDKTGERGKTEEFPFFTQWWLHEPGAERDRGGGRCAARRPQRRRRLRTYHPPRRPDLHRRARLALFSAKMSPRSVSRPFPACISSARTRRDHHGDTFHPEIHDSDGLLIDNGHGEWSWQPLQQQRMQQFYPVDEDNPAGFGLLQRDRQFDHYQDKDLLYNVRPSVWVVPHGNWGRGQGDALPASEQHQGHRQRRSLLAAGTSAEGRRPRDELDYTVEFYMNDAARPPLAYTRSTLINEPAPPPAPPPLPPGAPPVPPNPAPSSTPAKPAAAPAPAPPKPGDPTVPVQFVIDFVGNGIENLPANQPPDLDLSADPPADHPPRHVGREKRLRQFMARHRSPSIPTSSMCRPCSSAA